MITTHDSASGGTARVQLPIDEPSSYGPVPIDCDRLRGRPFLVIGRFNPVSSTLARTRREANRQANTAHIPKPRSVGAAIADLSPLRIMRKKWKKGDRGLERDERWSERDSGRPAAWIQVGVIDLRYR